MSEEYRPWGKLAPRQCITRIPGELGADSISGGSNRYPPTAWSRTVCGIMGELHFDDRPVDRDRLIACRDIMAHRGPDGADLWISADSRVGLAHRRLAIIDTSSAGIQPMHSSSGRCVIVYNGEIYNYRELRTELEAQGVQFRTRTDTEVILASYERWGANCVSRFNGMWAFALWDNQQGFLYCSRDRMGIKPFYYHISSGGVTFASEIKALLATGNVAPKVNGAAVYDYLNFGREDHTDETFVADVQSLPAGSCLTVNTDGRRQVTTYWQLELTTSAGDLTPNQRRDAVQELAGLLRDAVRLHLRSDVPTGICLSGGLDSSTITALAAELLADGMVDRAAIGDRLCTFTAHFPNEPIDETQYAQAIVECSGARGAWVKPEPEVLFAELDRLIWALEQPFVSTSMFAQWSVIQRAAEDGIKVLLDGQGGDELFGGYPPYPGVFLLHLLREGRVMDAARQARALRRVTGRNPWSTAAAQFGRVVDCNLPSPLRSIGRGRVRMVGEVMQTPFARQYSDRDHMVGRRPHRTNLQRRLADDTTRTNLPMLLRYEDRISMAFSLEARVPLLDYRIVEFAFRQPATFKLYDGWSKWAIRAAMDGRLPDVVRLRRDKLGFPTPQTRWLAEQRSWLTELFGGSELRSQDFIDGAAVVQRLPDILESPRASRELWRWLCLEMWMRRFDLQAA